ncbi:MAG TPA: hypothetical protein VJP58_08090 [Candidatus Nitrosocosmicus sp.]|nr:hypothetical protein [Candidatus Nitrosocosmicus sp.]
MNLDIFFMKSALFCEGLQYFNLCGRLQGIKYEICIEPINRNKVYSKPMKGTRDYCAMMMFLAYMREAILKKAIKER